MEFCLYRFFDLRLHLVFQLLDGLAKPIREHPCLAGKARGHLLALVKERSQNNFI